MDTLIVILPDLSRDSHFNGDNHFLSPKKMNFKGGSPK